MGVKNNIHILILSCLALVIISVSRLFIENRLLSISGMFVGFNILFIIGLVHLAKRYVYSSKKTAFIILLLALLFKIGIMLGTHMTVSFPDEINSYDALSWRQTLTWQGKDNFNLNECADIGGTTGYYYFLASIYYLLGHYLVIAKLFNVFFSVLSGFLIFLITKEIFNKDSIAKVALALALFFPSITFWSVLLLRDGLNLLIIAISFYFCIRFIKTAKIRYLLFLLTALVVHWNIRSHITLILIFGIITYSIVQVSRKSKMVFIASVCLLLISPLLLGIINMPLSVPNHLSFKYLDFYRNYIINRGGSAFLVGEDISTLGSALAFLPKGLAYFFFSPFPWEIDSVRKLIAFPDALLFFCLFPFMILGLILAYKRKKLIECSPIAIYCFLVIILYTFIDSNLGLLHRHRIQAVFFLLIFIAVGLEYTFNLLKKQLI